MKKKNEERDFEKEIETLTKEKDEYLNSWKRDLANYINYKNKESERTQELIFLLKENMFERLIPILDNFRLAEKSINKDLKEDSNIKGLLMIEKQLEDFAKNEGLEEISEIGIKVNPEIHDILEEVEGDNPQEVIEIIQKGYKLNGRVIRPAKVRIIK